MEPQNIYESLHHNAVFETDQISPSTKRGDSGGRNGGKMFTNHGLDRGLDRTDDHSYEVPSNTSILSTQKTPDVKTKGMTRDNELYESCAQDIMAAQDANIRRGIRELAISSSAEHNNSSLNCALVFCMLVLLLASIASSSYVFYQYEIQRTHSCISNDQSVSLVQKRNDTSRNEELSLRRLADEIKMLEDRLKHYKSNSTTFLTPDLREQRRRFSQLSKKAESFETKLQSTEKRLGDKIMSFGADFNKSLTQLNTELLKGFCDPNDCEERVRKVNEIFMAQVLHMSQVMVNNRPGIGKCVFKTKGSTIGETNQTASIIEKKDDAFSLIGVTCCTQYSHNLKYRAFLKVEKTVNITYSCQCLEARECNLCYWQCQ